MRPQADRRYFKELRFRQLRSFCLTAHVGSFSAAAEELGVSRPALWNQVRALEVEFACPLVRLRGRRVELTEAGQMLFDLAAPVVEAFDSIKDLFSERRHKTPLTLAIAATASLLNNELRIPLTRFQEAHPHVRMRFLEGPSRECVQRLEAGEVELAVFGYLGREIASPRLHLSPMGRYPMVAIYSKSSPLAACQRLDARELIRHNLILPAPDTSSRQLVDSFFGKSGVLGKLKIVLEAQNAIQFANPGALSLGVLVTTISPLRLAELQQQGKQAGIVTRELPAAGFEQIHCARRIGHNLSSSATDFLKLVLDDTETFVRRTLQRRKRRAGDR